MISILLSKKIEKKSQEPFEVCPKCKSEMYVESGRDLNFAWVCTHCNHELEINNDSE